ncbi:MAG: MarR family winged helix-turn-helix transcriptional regulator [Rhizomicrobium sp.]
MSHSFDTDLLVLLHDVARAMRTRFDQKARTAHAMTRAQWIILSRLEHQPGMSQNEMAAICEVEPITVARLVDRLEARGLVERRNDPTDRRIRRLHLLPAAAPFLEIINHARATMGERITAGLDQATRKTLLDALLTIKENIANESLTGDILPAAGE